VDGAVVVDSVVGVVVEVEVVLAVVVSVGFVGEEDGVVAVPVVLCCV
jgi:hypothetical protein